jgi:hypothetical protein
MKKFRLIIAAVSAIIFIASLFIIDYQSIISRSNLGAFLVIFSSALNIIAKILSNRYEKKHQVKQSKESNYLQQRKEKNTNANKQESVRSSRPSEEYMLDYTSTSSGHRTRRATSYALIDSFL